MLHPELVDDRFVREFKDVADEAIVHVHSIFEFRRGHRHVVELLSDFVLEPLNERFHPRLPHAVADHEEVHPRVRAVNEDAREDGEFHGAEAPDLCRELPLGVRGGLHDEVPEFREQGIVPVREEYRYARGCEFLPAARLAPRRHHDAARCCADDLEAEETSRLGEELRGPELRLAASVGNGKTAVRVHEEHFQTFRPRGRREQRFECIHTVAMRTLRRDPFSDPSFRRDSAKRPRFGVARASGRTPQH